MSLNDRLIPFAHSICEWAIGANWQAKGKGREVQARCPFHDDHTPSLSVNLRKGLWKCHAGCGEGDLVDLACKKSGLDARNHFPQLLALLEGITRSDLQESWTDDKRRKRPVSEQPGLSADEQLERQRKWGNPADWSRWIADAAQNPLPLDFLQARAIDPKVAEAASVVVFMRGKAPRSWWVPEGSAWTLCIPVMAGGDVLGFELRPEKGFPAKETGGKPLKAVSTGKLFFRAPAPRGDYGRWVFLCEGPLDALAAASAGLRASSALPGASSWDDDWGKHLWDRWVCVAYDDDPAGLAAGAKVAHALLPYACAVRVANWGIRADFPEMGSGKDVGDLLKALPPERRRGAMDSLADRARYNPRDLLVRLDGAKRERLQAALEELPTWPADHGVRVLRNAYWVEEMVKDELALKGPLTDFTFRVGERRRDDEQGLRRLIRVRGACDGTGSEGWAGDGEWRAVASARETVYRWGAYFLKDNCTNVQWGRILAREEKRLPMPTVRGLWHLGRVDLAQGGAPQYSPPTGPWIWPDASIEGGQVDPLVNQRVQSPTAGTLFVELTEGRIMAQSQAVPVRPSTLFRRAVAPWSYNNPTQEHRWALGWAAAVGFMPEWGRIFDGFPLLFLCGEKESGKTQFGTLIRRLWGIQGRPASFADSTTKGLMFDAASLSCMPLVLDEYRDNNDGDKELGKKLSWLRGVFDRTNSRRGTIKDQSVSRPVRAGLCILGQHWPERDEALNSRCMVVGFSKSQWNPNRTDLHWLTDGLRQDSIDFAAVGRHIAQSAQSLWPTMRDCAQKLRAELARTTAGGAGERVLDGAAICGAGWCAMTGDSAESVSADLIRFCLQRSGETKATNPVERFLEWIGARIVEGGPHFAPANKDHFCIWRAEFDRRGKQHLRIHVEKGIELYREHMARQRLPMPEEQELRRLFKNLPYCMGHYERFRLYGGRLGRGWVIDLEQGPERLSEAVQIVEDRLDPAVPLFDDRPEGATEEGGG